MNSNIILVLFALTTVTYAVNPWQSAAQPEWGPPQQQWQPPQAEYNQERCKIIPKNAQNTVITPVVNVNATLSFYYSCDSQSVIRSVGLSGTFIDQVTCYGTILNISNTTYYAVIGKQGGLGKNITLNLTNVTFLETYVNGNVDLLECGTITGGPCDGDEFSRVGIFEVDDQEGCSGKGVRGYNGLYVQIVVKGKCASRCYQGWYVESWDTPVNNWGSCAVTGSG